MNHFLTNENEWDDFVSICACDVKKLDSVALYMDSLFQDPVVAQRPETIKREKLQFLYLTDFQALQQLIKLSFLKTDKLLRKELTRSLCKHKESILSCLLHKQNAT